MAESGISPLLTGKRWSMEFDEKTLTGVYAMRTIVHDTTQELIWRID